MREESESVMTKSRMRFLFELGTGASNPHYGWEINPTHLTRRSTLQLVLVEHGGTILLFGPAWFGYSNAVVRISIILSCVLFT